MSDKECWLQYLKEYREFCLENYGIRLKSAEENEIVGLEKKMLSEGYQIEKSYYDFLREVDGLDYYGVMIFASKEYTFYKDNILYGIVEYNKVVNEENTTDSNIYFGVMGDELLAYTKEGKWILMDIISGSEMECYKSFNALMVNVMKALK